MKKNKQFESILYSAVGIVAMLIILLAVNFLFGGVRARVDLTQEKLFTLSEGTRAVLQKLDVPVKIRFYVTQGDNEMPVMLKNYAQQVEDLLSEYKQLARGKLEIEKLNPAPDSDAEDSATLDGIEGQFLRSGEKIYLGLAISSLDEKVALPFLAPDRDRLLEYDLTRAIARVANPVKPVIGVMTALPVFGQQMNPMMRMPQQGGQEPWVFLNELRRDFTVQKIDTDIDQIDESIRVLLVIHPKNLSEKTQYALDQFVLRGGRLIAFLDPQSTMDQNQMNQFQRAPSGGSNLERLLAAWGVNYDPSKVVADLQYPTQLRRGNRQESNPTWLNLDSKAINRNDVATSQIDSLLLPWPGAFTGTPAEGLKQTVLIESSPDAALVDAFMASLGAEAVARDLKPDGKRLALAIRLTGKFKTAFPEGKPAAPEPAEDEDEENPEPKAESNQPGLKESTGENSVILFADSDFLSDHVSVQKQGFFGQMIVTPINGNLTLTQNVVEQMAGDENLIEMRSRATLNRPFTRVREMQAKAQSDFQDRIQQLEAEVQSAQQKINDLQQKKEQGQRFILSPEQQAELEKVRQAEAKANKELKAVRKNLRKEVDALENRLKWINIAVMPLVVALSGLVLAVYKRKITAAK